MLFLFFPLLSLTPETTIDLLYYFNLAIFHDHLARHVQIVGGRLLADQRFQLISKLGRPSTWSNNTERPHI